MPVERFEKHLVDPEAEIEAIRKLGGLDGARVLEIGCGDGRLTFRYAPAAHSVFAIDPKPDAIAEAMKRLSKEPAGNIRFETASALNFDQAPASLDIVLFSHSL
jgi:ubiquinone/menaquinone biosynthesis C-methylase UbiE